MNYVVDSGLLHGDFVLRTGFPPHAVRAPSDFRTQALGVAIPGETVKMSTCAFPRRSLAASRRQPVWRPETKSVQKPI